MKSEIPRHTKIKAVYFDAAGTLIKPARRVGESYATIAAKYGKSVAPADLLERFRICFDAAPRLAFPNAAPHEIDRLEQDWWKNLVKQVFEPWGYFENFDNYFNELFAYFAEPTAWGLYPEALDTLAALRQRRVTLAVISNFDSRLVRILDGLGAGSWFADIFVSSRVGYAKPDRQIFDVALDRHGLAPGNAIHVGDSETNDLFGAQNAGLKGLLIDRGRQTDETAPERIASLQEIVTHLY
jgi:putative hydrolase of the HAD superfamily